MTGSDRGFDRRGSETQQRRLSRQFKRHAWLGPPSDVRGTETAQLIGTNVSKDNLCRCIELLLRRHHLDYRHCHSRPHVLAGLCRNKITVRRRIMRRRSDGFHSLTAEGIHGEASGEDHRDSDAYTRCA